MITYCNIGMVVDDDGRGHYISLAHFDDPREFGNTLLKDFGDYDAVASLVAGGIMGTKLGGLNAIAYLPEDADAVRPRSFAGGVDRFFSKSQMGQFQMFNEYLYCWSPSRGWMFKHNGVTKELAYG